MVPYDKASCLSFLRRAGREDAGRRVPPFRDTDDPIAVRT